LQILPDGVPITFTFMAPLETKAEGESIKRFSEAVDGKESIVAAIALLSSKAFGKILNQEYQVDHSKIHVIPGGVDISRFQTNLSRHVAPNSWGRTA